MKNFLLSLAFIIGGITAAIAQSAEMYDGPTIAIDKDVHNYGTIEKGTDGTCAFTITNVGTAPLIIERCKGNCGCTVPQCQTTPIAPGKTSQITVVYDTNRRGPINKEVTIFSNAVNEPVKIIRIKGQVVAETVFTPIEE